MTVSAVERLLAGRVTRADARRNVELLVGAAREAANEGGEFSAHDIARRAGVGVGTFYRRVGTLETLLEAVLEEVAAEILAKAEEGLAEPDAWEGFRRFAMAYVDLRNELCDLNAARGGGSIRALAEMRDSMRRLVERAQESGGMRADLGWTDVAFLLVSVSTGDHTIGLRAAPHQRERNLQVVLDGMRTPDPGPLPGEPPRAEEP
ncbi:TetR/AcrR family transcriptional regulator [Actinomadura macrotermitis]|uniref:HTH tetR-type domain-containing protein n=1 Tax=Actinomadura macrotermitis TaxID=2585200 RepID=A0A7K0C6C6_9ACTN|nr:TetR/AcrR family transcriptional regulator [Actinomadura macrotermitis]MQY08364.1 hypothetical protein [Actinomadura macrotermitis]